MQLAVIGAGHAGMEAAKAAAEAGIGVTLFSAETVLPYFRPRLPAVAFGQESQDAIRMKPPEWFTKQAIDLRLDSPVTALDPTAGRLTVAGETLAFDAAVLATGAMPVLPPFVAGCPERVLPLWSAAQAQAIRALVRPGGHVVVVGGGILGIEAGLRAREAGMRVTMVEKLERLMPMQFGPPASAFLLQQITAKQIDVRLGQSVQKAEPAGTAVRIALDRGVVLEADFAVVCIGARPGVSLAARAGLAVERGVCVDDHLRTSCQRLFAAGDLIQFQGVSRCSARDAAAQGRVAGANAAAQLTGKPLGVYASEGTPLMFKSKDVEMYALGEPGGTGCTEWFPTGTAGTAFRALVLRAGRAVGAQLIGTRQGLDDYLAMVRAGSEVKDG